MTAIEQVSQAETFSLGQDILKVLQTDEMRVTLDGPMAGSLMDTQHHFELDDSKVEEGMVEERYWYGLLLLAVSQLGLFWVEDALELSSQSSCKFPEDTFFKQRYRKKSTSFKKAMIFIQDNASSHASKYSTAWLSTKGLKDDSIMTWLPSSPYLIPIERGQYTSLKS